LGGWVICATLNLCFCKANLDAVKASYSNYFSSMKLCRKNCSGFRSTVAFYFSDKRLLHDAINDVKVELYGFLFFTARSTGTECSINRVYALSGKIIFFFVHGTTTSVGPGSPYYPGFTIRFRYTTLRGTPLDEWSARHRPLPYNTNTHNRHRSLSTGLEPTFPASELPQTHALDRAVTEIDPGLLLQKKILTHTATQTLLTGRKIDCIMNMPRSCGHKRLSNGTLPRHLIFPLLRKSHKPLPHYPVISS